jgi:signal transduction histidine kinase/DNA-binding CsgD family transcriptional regulator
VVALLLRKNDLSHRIWQEAIHQERNRIARELHDGVTQQIIHALHKIEYVQHLVHDNGEEQVLSELHHIQRTLHAGLQELRDTMSALLPEQVEEVPLIEKIQQLVNEYQQCHLDVEVELKIIGLDKSDRLSPQLTMSVFYCVQEALTNAWKHAQATSIQVQLHRLAHWLLVEIHDNGLGFQTEQASRASKRYNGNGQHFGLVIMRERIKEAGGLWELQSQPGQGTTVRARFLIAEPINQLTKRQHEILHLVSEGLSNREIANHLNVSIDTVKTHMRHIIHKLGAKDRVQAVAVAYRNRWL